MSKITDVQYKTPNRFYSLDILRGLAALTIVIGHWPRFYYKGVTPTDFNTITLPFHNILMLFINFGSQSVNLFFVLSGFIFYLLYSKQIRSKSISAWNFTVLRFSRLYPLHFITLIIITILQTIAYYSTGSFYIIKFNDVYHFILNLFFVSSWGFQSGSSFNAVIWSLSIEVLMYLLFFIICWKLHFHPIIMIIFSMLKFPFLIIDSDIIRGMFFFFVGGFAYSIYSIFVNAHTTNKQKGTRKEKTRIQNNNGLYFNFICIAVLWYYALSALVYQNQNIQMVFNITNSIILVIRTFDVFFGILFSWTIISLVLYEYRNGTIGKSFAWIGDISYSTYLWHTPIQVAMFLGLSMIGINIFSINNILLLFSYLFIVISISMLSYQYIEKPIQSILRGKLIQT